MLSPSSDGPSLRMSLLKIDKEKHIFFTLELGVNV